MFNEDYLEFFDDFAVDALYTYSGSSVALPVIIDYEIEKFTEYGSEKVIGISIPRSIIAPRRGATITVNSDIYTLGDKISDDHFIVQMEATK